MGFRSTWIAVPRSETERALAVTGLAAAGESDTFETGWWLVELGEWTVIVGSGWDYMGRLTEEQTRALATPGEAIFWYADDSSMTAQMAQFRAGELAWSLAHHEGKPVITGDTPTIVSEAVAQQRSKQVGPDAQPNVDYLYEAAHIAGERIVGFRHDDVQLASATLRELVPSDAAKRVEQCGPIDVEIIELPGMDTHVVIRARRRAQVERIVERQFDRDGDLRVVIEVEGFELRRGEEHRVNVCSPFPRIDFTVELKGLLGTKAHDVRVV